MLGIGGEKKEKIHQIGSRSGVAMMHLLHHVLRGWARAPAAEKRNITGYARYKEGPKCYCLLCSFLSFSASDWIWMGLKVRVADG
jgi:hypothetical protein